MQQQGAAPGLVRHQFKTAVPVGNALLRIRLRGDRGSHRILGAQIVGHVSSEVSKRIDVLAAAIYNNMKVVDLSDIDLSYTPPLSSPWDPVQITAQAWKKLMLLPNEVEKMSR